jgi:DNA repair ATPase RecN
MTITEKTAYLKGLLEGLSLDKQTNEGKLFTAIIEALDEIAQTVAELDEEGRKEEVARMISGADGITDDTLQYASGMLKAAGEIRSFRKAP